MPNARPTPGLRLTPENMEQLRGLTEAIESGTARFITYEAVLAARAFREIKRLRAELEQLETTRAEAERWKQQYEAKLTEAQERITSLEDKIRRQREALRVLNEAQARITSQLDLEAARRAAEMVQTLKHEPGKAAVELAVARERIAELEALLNDHGPNGRNVT